MEVIIEAKLKRLIGKQVTVKSSNCLFRGFLSLKDDLYTAQLEGNYVHFKFSDVMMVMAHSPIVILGQLVVEPLELYNG